MAVLGCGIDRDYPAAHRELATRIVASGWPRRVGVRARGRAGTVAVPRAEPDHRGALRGDGRGRGARALRSADHRRLRARGRPRGDGRAGRDHLCAVGGRERAAATWRHAGDRRRRCAGGARDRACATARACLRRARPPPPWLRGWPTPLPHRTSWSRSTALGAGEVAAALVELELAGAVASDGGVYRPTTIAR